MTDNTIYHKLLNEAPHEFVPTEPSCIVCGKGKGALIHDPGAYPVAERAWTKDQLEALRTALADFGSDIAKEGR